MFKRTWWLVFCVVIGLGTGCGRAPAPPESAAKPKPAPVTNAPAPASATAPKPAASASAPQVVAAMNRGVSQMGQYDYEAAARSFEAALKLAPDLSDAKINLAIALFNRADKARDDLGRAGTLLDAVLAQEPENVRALYFKGILLQHTGRTADAIPLFEQVVKQRPDDGAAWYLLGLCKQRLNRPAEKELRKAVELRPYLYSAWYKLFQAALAAQDPQQAKQFMERFKEVRNSPLGESIELPQYNQMGDLALALPLPARLKPAPAKHRYQAGPPRRLATLSGPGQVGLAAADFDGDGAPDLLALDGGRLKLWRGDGQGKFTDATAAAGLAAVTNAVACAVGDFDNDEVADLFLACAGPDFLFRGLGDGRFTNVTASAGVSGGGQASRMALFLDADHDADLDLFVGGDGNRCRLFRNNADGTFTDIAEAAGIACAGDRVVAVLPGDLDGDRDADLVVLRRGAPARVFFNELLGRYRQATNSLPARGDFGGVLQDFDGDGTPDLLVAGGEPPALTLWVGDGTGRFHRGPAFSEPGASPEGPRAVQAADVDGDGDLDVVVAGAATAQLLLNDGAGHFSAASALEAASGGGGLLADLTGDFVPDWVTASHEGDGAPALVFFPGQLDPPAHALAVRLTGVRGRDGRTRSPATGFGAKLVLRAGLREQTRLYTGLNGGPNQSWLPAVFGLAEATEADYLRILWPDGVAQVEIGLAAGQTHKFSELQRKVSSCPVLFAWNGRRFAFVTDFAGVGGLGYFAAPGEYAQPQVEEHVKIEPGQLVPKDGAYELRITEPMEEVAYVDRLELQVVDHPAEWSVFPDERLALTGPPPTHRLLVVRERIWPERALAPDGVECTANLRRVDRRYAYEPKLDRRFIGYCRPHTLELDFGGRLSGLRPGEPVFLFINGFIEYPYSSTVYAAGQARLGWQAIRIDAAGTDGHWRTLVPDAGAPGGMARMFTVDLTGQLADARRLRLTTNMELYYDQIFLAPVAGADQVRVRRLPPRAADFRHVGFALEFSPDGRLPLIYDYDLTQATAPFHVQRGPYTRYGPVTELLQAFDDRYVMVGPGDEIAVRFDASALKPPAPGMARSFILVSHAYCKDMDLYTATPETVTPLPFRQMSRYPYSATEHFPDTPELRAWRETYNTRRVE